jgi:hypothetical protein
MPRVAPPNARSVVLMDLIFTGRGRARSVPEEVRKEPWKAFAAAGGGEYRAT